MQVIDPFKMSSISAEFGSLHRTHHQLQPGTRELQVNTPEQYWLISGSLGSFPLTGNARGARCSSSVQGPRPNINYLKAEFGSFKKSRPLRLPSYNPGTESTSLWRKSWATAPENSLTRGPPWALGKLTRINTGAP